MKEKIRSSLLDAGAIAVGFAKAGEIDAEADESYKKWIGEGYNGEMAYLERHIPLRFSTENVLPGAATVISMAFGYAPKKRRSDLYPYIASYADGEDYHIVLRERLQPIINDFEKEYGGKWRICIDSAPVAERYWAVKSGIGFRGLNGSIIIDCYGSLCFLVEILTTLEITPDSPSTGFCSRCGKCIRECPGKALRGDGTMDARNCINYLTIEKKGDFSESENFLISGGSGYLFGCDRCQRVCHYNHGSNPAQEIFKSKILDLKAEDILSMSREDFKKRFLRSPLFYAGYDKLHRNALTLKIKKD